MKFFPKNKRYLKIFKIRLNNKKKLTNKTIKLKYGQFGLKALTPGCLTVKHFEILRLKLKQYFKRKGNIYFRKIPYLFTSKKPAEVRMGKGKGGHFEWICPIQIGQIFVEFSIKKNRSKSLFQLLKMIRKCKKRIPFKCKLITKLKREFCNNMEKKYNILVK